MILSSPKARRFRTHLRNEAAKRPNFNGHYRVVKWGCGTNCIEWAVIDLESGALWFAKEPLLSCMSNVPEVAGSWFEMKVESRLLIANECADTSPGRTFTHRYWYEWRDGRPHLIRREGR